MKNPKRRNSYFSNFAYIHEQETNPVNRKRTHLNLFFFPAHSEHCKLCCSREGGQTGGGDTGEGQVILIY